MLFDKFLNQLVGDFCRTITELYFSLINFPSNVISELLGTVPLFSRGNQDLRRARVNNSRDCDKIRIHLLHFAAKER